MGKTKSSPLARGLTKGLLASVAALCLVLVISMTAWASQVSFSDPAGVFSNSDRSQIQNATSFQYPVYIYTAGQNDFSGSSSQFDQRAAQHVNSNPANAITVAISTYLHRVYIGYGRNVPLSNSAVNSARSAFSSGYSNGGYTTATVNSLQSLQNSLGSSSNNGGNTVPAPARGGSSFNFLPLCLLGIVVLGLIALFTFMRRRMLSGGNQTGYTNPVVNQPYNQQPYNQPYQNYPPGYPQQRQGMNPLAAGGLGAAAGGLLGYELGKSQGERDERQEGGNYGGDGGNGGNFGGGGGGDFGGGGGGDFGGGGSGGDFGGGGGGDFGGGGGGGGGNF